MAERFRITVDESIGKMLKNCHIYGCTSANVMVAKAVNLLHQQHMREQEGQGERLDQVEAQIKKLWEKIADLPEDWRIDIQGILQDREYIQEEGEVVRVVSPPVMDNDEPLPEPDSDMF